MITAWEKMPLQHQGLAKGALGAGIILILSSIYVFMSLPQYSATWGMGLAFVGLAAVFISVLYWGCGNKSCSPWD